MQHDLHISVTREPGYGNVVAVRGVSVRERFLRFLLGDKRRLTILIPGNTVSDIAIEKVKDGGETLEAVRD